jgi:hypothetical protein
MYEHLTQVSIGLDVMYRTYQQLNGEHAVISELRLGLASGT